MTLDKVSVLRTTPVGQVGSVSQRAQSALDPSIAWLLLDQAFEPTFTWRHGEMAAVTSWNSAAERLYGFSRELALGRDPRELLGTAFPGPSAAVDAALARERLWKGELVQRTASGKQLVIDTVMTLVKLPDGQELVLETGRDVTEQRALSLQLATSEAKYRELANAMPQIVWTTKADGSTDWLNERWFEYTGLRTATREEVARLVHPDDLPACLASWHEALHSQSAWEFEYRLKGRDGRYRWHLGRIVPIRDAGGQLQRWVATATNIEERKQAEQALREVDRRKDEFLALLSHELRNPLAPILTAVQLMKLRGDAPAPNERQVIERQAQHMVRLVDDLLDVARVARGKVELRKQRLELSLILAKALEATGPMFEQKQHNLSISRFPEGLTVDGDEARLTQVVANLLNNAARYTPPRGKIVISAALERGQVVLRVQDNGVGIPTELLPRIFEMFVQGPRGPDRAEGGLGLGLALVASLTALHGGSVEAHSLGPGCGSEFVVRLPAVDPDGALRQTPVPPLNLERAEHCCRILVVDDNEDAAELVAVTLMEAGHHVRVAHDPSAALRIAPDFRPEVAILDIGLPVMDGYQLARELRARLDSSLGLIALSGYGQEQDKRRSLEAGFASHLVKPVEVDALLARVSEVAGRVTELS